MCIDISYNNRLHVMQYKYLYKFITIVSEIFKKISHFSTDKNLIWNQAVTIYTFGP